jgi:uncharacterized protein YfaP (DUF2135 family)
MSTSIQHIALSIAADVAFNETAHDLEAPVTGWRDPAVAMRTHLGVTATEARPPL